MKKQKQNVENWDEGDTRVAPEGEFKAGETGVWIVYDLEANRKIQELLTENKFAFKFIPRLKR